jgi:AraC-like DNA-binding protein
MGGLSPFHLVRKFRREIGLPPHAYYEQLRIARCKALLHDRRRLSEVAFLMRYSDQSHFTRQFGNAAGVSPGKYAAMVSEPGRRLALPVRARTFNTPRHSPGEDAMNG